MPVLLLLGTVLFLLLYVDVVNAFGMESFHVRSWKRSGRGSRPQFIEALSVLREEIEGEFGEDLDTGSVVIEDLNWRVEKLRLEEQNTQRFLKSQPRFLPYRECCKWVQAFGRWKSEKDWKEWIAMGEKRNAYIPVSLCSLFSAKFKW